MGLSDTDMTGFSTSGDESTASSLNKTKRSSQMANLSPGKGKSKKQGKKSSLVASTAQTRLRSSHPSQASTSQQQLVPPQQEQHLQLQHQHQQVQQQQSPLQHQQKGQPQPQEVEFVSDFATHNKFSVLPEVGDSSMSDHKPPPLYIYKINNYIGLNNDLRNLIGSDNYSCKSRLENILVSTNTSEAYRAVVHYLNQNNIEYHTYQLKKDKAFRVVLRHIHHSVPPQEIQQELQYIGFKVRNITNVRHPLNKNPLPLFFVDLEPDSNNKNIFNVTRLLNTVVKVEEPHKTKEIVQCKRCQQYGHTRAYCHVAPRCVKCAGPHLWDQCNKPPDTAPTCALCFGPHSASFRGCEVHKELQRIQRERQIARGQRTPSRAPAPISKIPTQRDFPTLQQTTVQGPPLQQQLPQQRRSYQPTTRGLPYSEVVRSHPSHQHSLHTHQNSLPSQLPNSQPDNITTVLNSFFQRFESLLTPLVSLLNTLITQLLPCLKP